MIDGSGFEGHLDSLSAYSVEGWADEGLEPAQVTIRVNDEHVGTCRGGIVRDDLRALGRSYFSGFHFHLQTRLRHGDVVSALGDGGQHLVNSPKIYDDLLDQNEYPSPHYPGQSSVFFLHIPKTAGTSLRSIAQRFETRCRFVYQNEFYNLSYIRSVRMEPLPAMFFGHFSYGAHVMVNAPPRYATVVRHPVARIVSLYAHEYAAGVEKARLGPYGNEGLRRFMASGHVDQTNNNMCRVISGVVESQVFTGGDRWLLDYAWHNVKSHFDFITTMEHVGAAGRYLEGVGGLDPEPVGKTNTSMMAPLVADERSIAMIEDSNALDLELFRRVQSLG